MGEYLDLEFRERHYCKTPATLVAKAPVWKCDCGQVWVYGDLRGFKGFLANAMWYPIEQWERRRGPIANSTEISRRQASDKAGLWFVLVLITGFFVFVFANFRFL